MAIGVTLIVVGILIIAVWIIIETKRLRHKAFAMFLIALIIFTYFSFTLVMKKHDVDLSSSSGLVEGGKLYFSWLGAIFGNFKTITSNAVKMDWSGEETNSSEEAT